MLVIVIMKTMTMLPMERLDHLYDGLAALAGHRVLVEVGQLLELAHNLAEDELALVVPLDLAGLRHVHCKLLGEQFDDLLRQLPELPAGLVLATAAAVQQDVPEDHHDDNDEDEDGDKRRHASG